MDFNLTDEQQMLREGAERYLLESYTFEGRRSTLSLANRCDEENWRSFADLGWLGLTIPEEAGGLGAGLVEAALLAEAIGRRLVIEPYATTAVLATNLLVNSRNKAACTDLLGAIVAGDLRVALACYEPGRRYELDAPAVTARKTQDGFALSGSKVLVLDAPAAHKFIVSAAIDGAAGCGLFLVDSAAAGVVQQSYSMIDGRRASDVEFADAASSMLCDGATGPAVLDEALDRFRVVQVADALGAMEAIIEQTAEHLRNRKQFGQPLAAFQALQHRMAEMFVEVQETRSALYHALAHIEADPGERRSAVSSAVVVASEAGRVVGGQGIQLHGGVGMTDEYQVGHFFKRLVVLEKSWGDVDFHLDRIAGSYH